MTEHTKQIKMLAKCPLHDTKEISYRNNHARISNKMLLGSTKQWVCGIGITRFFFGGGECFCYFPESVGGGWGQRAKHNCTVKLFYVCQQIIVQTMLVSSTP